MATQQESSTEGYRIEWGFDPVDAIETGPTDWGCCVVVIAFLIAFCVVFYMGWQYEMKALELRQQQSIEEAAK